MNVRQSEPSNEAFARLFVRALWGSDVRVNAFGIRAGAPAPLRPRFLGPRVWLPASLPPGAAGNFSAYSLAAAAHAAAHLRFGAARFPVHGLKPVQVAIISLLEDARVERLASEHFPGLSRLWAPFHLAPATSVKTSTALLAGLARSLHSPARQAEDDPWLQKAQELFFAHPSDWREPGFVRELGGRLGNDLGQMRVQFNAREYLVQPPYRDDNVGLWLFEPESTPEGIGIELAAAESLAGKTPGESPAAAAQSEPAAGREPVLLEERLALRQQGAEAAASAVRYPEWDYVIARERPGFCTIVHKHALAGDAHGLETALLPYGPVRRRLERAASRLASEQREHLRRLSAGDRLDLRAAIAALVAGAGAAPALPRVYRRARFRREPPALLVLIDSSESLNLVPPGASSSVLELARRASALLASTLNAVCRDWAIHAFSSNGRHDIGYFRFKDFEQPYDDGARSRLAGMRAGFSTRLGAALRHAGQLLAARSARRKLLLVVSDGEPSDVDVHDPKYLPLDARRATQDNRRRGVVSFCVGLDASAERHVRVIFGPRNFLLIDRLEQLPERLGQLSLQLAG